MLKDKKTFQINLTYFVLIWFIALMIKSWMSTQYSAEVISYSQFETYLDQGQIENVEISDNTITGKYKQPVENAKSYFTTTRVPPELVERLSRAGVEYKGVIGNTLLRDILSWVLSVLLFFGLWMFVFKRMADKQGMGGFMSIGKSKAKVYMEKDTQVTFDDVAGVDEAKIELEEILEFLKNPQDYGQLGAHIPKGVLLVGPPGTGKTLLARAVAGEAKVPFFSINGSEFVEMFVGVGAARVRDLFEQARKSAPAIIFIDELDALGRARGAFSGMGGHDEREQTLNQLLSELDGFDPSNGLVLLAATNRPEILDPALLRAGRFDRQVLVDRPDKTGRIQILKVHLRKVTIADDVDPETIASLTTGFSGADLANLVNESALLATRRHAAAVALDDFTQAIERIVAGLEKRNRLLNPHEREVVAHHEMGHALVAGALPGNEEVHKVSIIPRGIGALGYTLQRPTEDRFLMSKQELSNKITMLLGGRAAETLIFDELSTGAADDLVKATDIARSMVTRYGMDEGLGFVTYDKEQPTLLGTTETLPRSREYSEDTARQIDIAVRRILTENFARAKDILAANRELLEQGATKLLQKETLDEAELQSLMQSLKLSDRAESPKALLGSSNETRSQKLAQVC